VTETRSIAARVHGTYLVAPPAGGEAPTAALIGFHGYGELAEHHLAELHGIPGSERWLLCAVQALHPFYKRTGELGACWMTKLDREQAIADNSAYATAVLDALAAEHPSLERVGWIGFSQGVAMAYRAAVAAAGGPDPIAAGRRPRGVALVILAGDLPPEVAAGGLDRLPPVLIGTGRADDWYRPEAMEREVAVLREAGVEAEALAFDGGHEWVAEFTGRAGRFLAGRLDGEPGD
jgi:predicted esterase